MAKTLVVAEKPSVAADIARALGGCKRMQEHFESDEYVISSAVGHLLEMKAPDSVEVKRGKWSLTNLPVLPTEFDLQPVKQTESRLRALQKLYKRKDVGAVINACDAGREGELIFHNLMRYMARDEKPIKRLWLSSMTAPAIRRGFEELRPPEEVESLKDAAVSRAAADWLVGINSTRAMTALHSAVGGFFLTTVGRVQTPTLALLVERDKEIKAFKSEPYWEVTADFEVEDGSYQGVWIDPAKKTQAKRIFKESLVGEILSACAKGTAGHATETVKPTTESPPWLLDLTSLQREANSRFGLSAKATLAAAQSLYERHKLITYPRTDSRYLPEDYPAVVVKTLGSLSNDSEVGAFCQKIIDQRWVVGKNKRIFNNAKVSDHFGIIPTGNAAKPTLKEVEKKIYRFIQRRFIAAFFPPARYLVTERTTKVGAHAFLSKGQILTEAGWREVERPMSNDKSAEQATNVAIKDGGENTTTLDIASEAKHTQPPPHYNEATLLSAMESAGKRVEDEALREAMRERGLGTPATRASIIEGLLRERYITRDRRALISTPKAVSLMRLLSVLKIDSLTKPELTGEWEFKLRQIEKKKVQAEAFMDEIRALTTAIVDSAKSCGDVERIDGDYATLSAPCPVCGGVVKESHRKFSCASSSCTFSIWKAMAGRELSVEETEQLLANGTSEMLDGFRSRLGREFSAKLILKKDDKGELRATFDFDQPDENETPPSAEELQAKAVVGPCPKCGAAVRDMDTTYTCEKAMGEGAACDYKFYKRILQQPVTAEQIGKLLNDGKTDLLKQFVSKKTNRPFSARLTIDLSAKDGKIAFAFEPRQKKAAKPKSTKSSVSKKAAAKKPAAKKLAAKSAAKK